MKCTIWLEGMYKALRDEFESLQQSSEQSSIKRGEPVHYTPELMESDIRQWAQDAEKVFGALEKELLAAAHQVPNWPKSANLTIRPSFGSKDGPISWDGEDPKLRTTSEVFVHHGDSWKGSPSFTVFVQDNGQIHGIDDVLDAGDSDFFKDPEIEIAYFGLTEELRHPGRAKQQAHKIVTLWTARPKKDRHLYDGASKIPSNVFLTTSEDEAYGYSSDLGGNRDIYLVKIQRGYLVETLNQGHLKNYQTYSSTGWVPVESCSLVHEGSTGKIAGNTPRAIEDLTDSVRTDPEYLAVWHDNLACAAVDEGVSWDVANLIAKRFLKNLFDIDSQNPDERIARVVDRHLMACCCGQSEPEILAEDLQVEEPPLSRFAKYKAKKMVPKANGKGKTEVYVYSERQVQNRHREKAERLEAFKDHIPKLRAKVKKDLASKDPETRETALIVALIDETHERIGSEESANGELNDDGESHYGVSQFLKSHIRFTGAKAVISYTGKSGVDHVKEVTTPYIVSALKKQCESVEGKQSKIFEATHPTKVNEYLKPYEVTAKDLRGAAANALMQKALRKARKGALPEEKKEREKKLKEEFKSALESVAEEIGHESATLKGQYLAPSIEESYLKDGTVAEELNG